MTDGGAGVQPGQGQAPVRQRPRSAFIAHEVFGHGADAVLVEPEIARDLRIAAEFASQERRIAGGLLYGRLWADDEGQYLVVGGFLEAGPGENHHDKVTADGRDSFALSDADLRLLREDATRTYSAVLEVGWWRSLPRPGEFGPGDFESQRALVGPGGAGLLIFGSGLKWGTAYLGPDGEVPGSARSFIPVPRPAPDPRRPVPGLGQDPVPGSWQQPALDAVHDDTALDDTALDDTVLDDTAPEPSGDAAPDGDAAALEPAADLEPVAASARATSLVTRRPVLTPAPRPSGPRMISPIRGPAREWGGTKLSDSGSAESRTPTDIKIVVGALIITAVLAATMVGALLSNVLAAVIAAFVLLLGLSGFLWMSRL